MAIELSQRTSRGKGDSSKKGLFHLRAPAGFFLALGTLLTITLLLIWAGLRGFVGVVERQRVETEQEIRSLEQGRTAQSQEVFDAVARMANVAELLESHKNGRNVFTFLEEKVQPNVFFVEPAATFDRQEVRITVETETLRDLAQQMAAFENDPRVKLLVVDTVERTEDTERVSAQFTIQVHKEAFLVE